MTPSIRTGRLSHDLIESIHARQILDSRGNPTVECEVQLADGCSGRAAVPSGASTGAHEAWETSRCDKSQYLGRGVHKAVANINGPIADAWSGMNALDQSEIDATMIKTGMAPQTKRNSVPMRSWVCRWPGSLPPHIALVNRCSVISVALALVYCQLR